MPNFGYMMIDTSKYLGPQVPIGITRKRELFSSNLAPSFIPSRLLSQAKPIKTDAEKLALKPRVSATVLNELSEDLKDHMETRIQLFLQQLMLVYKTQLCFSLYTHADMQVGYVPSNGDKAPTYVGAHSGTLPTLRLSSSSCNGASVSFAKDTAFYHQWNTTTYLPEVANQIDSALDKSVSGSMSLREIATQILNQVSIGAIKPKEGLREFLIALTSTIHSLQSSNSSAEREIVLDSYLSVAANYFNKLESGYPLLQKLLLQPLDVRVNKQFYKNVQTQMHGVLNSELQSLQPEALEALQLPPDLNLGALQALIAEKLPSNSSKTAQNYIKLCSLAERVKTAALQYFIFLHGLTPTEQDYDLSRILQIKRSTTISNVGLSSPAKALYDEIMKALKDTVKEPTNVPFIFLSTLIQISQEKITKEQTSIASPAEISSEEKEALCLLIQEQTELANIQPTVTSEKYVKTCSNAEKVQKAAKLFFDELLRASVPLKTLQIDRLLQIKASELGSSGLWDSALALHQAVLETLKAKPRNMPIILSRLLQVLNSP